VGGGEGGGRWWGGGEAWGGAWEPGVNGGGALNGGGRGFGREGKRRPSTSFCEGKDRGT